MTAAEAINEAQASLEDASVKHDADFVEVHELVSGYDGVGVGEHVELSFYEMFNGALAVDIGNSSLIEARHRGLDRWKVTINRSPVGLRVADEHRHRIFREGGEDMELSTEETLRRIAFVLEALING